MPLQATSGAASQDAFGGNGVAVVPTYIEDVFSAYPYQGNASGQTITNGIDLTKGGLIWSKCRTLAYDHVLVTTTQGLSKYLVSNNTDALATNVQGVTSVSATGYAVGTGSQWGGDAAEKFVGWTFRKQPKFFDVVTWTGTGGSRTITTALNGTTGCIILKNTSAVDDWYVVHRSGANGFDSFGILSKTNAFSASGSEVSSVTNTSFTVTSYYNGSGVNWVAYIFAHDAGGFGLTGTDNVISCGSVANGNSVATLGWEPQWVLIKGSQGSTAVGDDWLIVDNMRGMVYSGNSPYLAANKSNAENYGGGGGPFIQPTPTGFQLSGLSGTGPFIYIAIRRGPMKVPTTGTSVYENTAYTGNGTAERKIGSSVLTDLLLLSNRDATAQDWASFGQYVFDRLRGQDRSLGTANTSAEVSGWNTYCNIDMNTGWDTGSTTGQVYLNKTSATYVSNAFRRAPSFMDVVCYTGTGSALTVSHNLAAVPELIIGKNRTTAGNNWPVLFNFASTNMSYAFLNQTGAGGNDTYANVGVFSATPTSTSMFLLSSGSMNTSANNHVAYLFSTCAGVSKVFSYTGNGSSQTINCGFTGGARFVLIKRTDSTGDWYVWDTARGIVAGNDPHLSLNTTSAEVTSNDTIDTDNTGFVVNQVTATNVNVSSATYIGLAIA